jgi:polyhydroxyalkanoate synthesis regulator phasin
MATRKRTSSRSRRNDLLGRAVRAGRSAFREAESRVPPDVRRQIERSIKDGQKTLKTAIDQLEAQVRRTARQADVDKALKRLDGLTKQVQQLARTAATRGAARGSSAPRRAASKAKRTTRKAAGTAKRKAATRRPAATRKAAPRKAPARSAAPSRSTSSSSGTSARRSAPRRRPAPTSSAGPEIRYVPPAPEPAPMPEPVDSEG